MSTWAGDLRSAKRLLFKSPAFTAIAVCTLALGIGLNTAVFSVIEALLLRPLAGARAPQELVQIYRSWPGIEFASSSPMTLADVRERASDVFTEVAAWSYEALNLSADGKSQRLFGQMVSANYFNVLGARAERGRLFVPAEDRDPGAHPITVLSYATWQGMFGGDPGVIGKKVILNGTPWEIVGVAPRELRSPIPLVAPALWVPLMQLDQVSPSRRGGLTRRDDNWMNLIARLKPGVSAAQAQVRLSGIVPALASEFPDDYRGSKFEIVRQADAGIHPSMRNAQVGMSAVVFAVVVLLLLIACVNVANLFLARARDRWREMAVRLSLGARRGILIRQLLIESSVFSVAAGLLGLVIASWAFALLNQVRLPVDVDFSPNLELNGTVMAFTFGITVLTGITFGIAPALQATKPSLVPTLKGESPTGDGRSRASRTLVVAQMALSLILLVCAGLFLRNLRAATTIDKGFDGGPVLLADIDVGIQGYSDAKARTFYDRLLERLALLPNVKSASIASSLPLGLGNSQTGVEIAGYNPGKDEQTSIDYATVSPGYFNTLGIRLKSGRGFLAADDTTAPNVLIVNEHFAARFWPGQDALGKTVRAQGHDRTIVGIVPNGKYRTLGESQLDFMYFPTAQNFRAQQTLGMRTAGDPSDLVEALRSEVAALDPTLPLANVRTLDTYLGISLLPARLAGGALAVFGLLGLILSSVGIYGVTSYSVSQRTREIGIRMAIGAPRELVLKLVMRQGLTLVGIGTVIGLVAALGAAQLLKGILYGAKPIDPATFVGVPLVLIAVAAAAIWIPARRASNVDPVRAIKTE